jgi:tetratricopeptide (TPR) repeat protein
LAFFHNDLRKGLDRLIEAEFIFRQIGQSEKSALSALACCLGFTTWVRTQLGDLVGALACAQEGSTYFHATGNIWADLDITLGDISYRLGDYEVAEKIFKKAILTMQEVNDPRLVDDCQRKLGDVYRAQGRFDQALSTFREALFGSIEKSNWYHVVWLQCCFAFTTIQQACELPSDEAAPFLLRAVRIFGALQPMMEETGGKILIEYQAEYDRSQEYLRQRLDPAALEAAWAEGRVMNRKQIVAYLQEFDIQS